MVVDTRRSGPTAFQGMSRAEHIEFYFRQHWIRLLWPFSRLCLACTVIAGGAWFVTAGIPDASMRRLGILALLLIFLALQASFLVRFYRHFLYVIIVTDRKIHRIKKTFLAIDDHQSIDLWSLQDINKSQRGIIQNLFGFGTLTLEAQESILKIHFVPKITKHYESILRLQGRGQRPIPQQAPA
ncbi:MAG: Uncharacterized protein G01um101425_173 [Candidatus Peregrinibacteria bacterium Gr01-1014_25]|nr:MAG: Uncharacterized protein G01um101425_173 [Candidatus Peregrinibacteria bacterium Gr01-1014_25]